MAAQWAESFASEKLDNQRIVLSINRQINGFLHRPMRLVLANPWAFSGPFQTLPFRLDTSGWGAVAIGSMTKTIH